MVEIKCHLGDSTPLAQKGIGAVIECLELDVRVSNPIVDIKFILERVLPKYLILADPKVVFTENEPLGTNYMLYKYHVYDGDVFVSSCRAIVKRMVLEELVCTLDSSQKGRIVISSLEGREEPRLTKVTAGIHPPPGQVYIDYFVVYRILGTPEVDVKKWRLKVSGRVRKPLELSLEDLKKLPRATVVRDFHCVTGWSVASVKWEGVRLRLLAEMADPLEDVRWVYAKSLDGYSTIIPLEDFLGEDSLLVLRMNDQPLTIEHGFPARLLIPHLYGWKSIKWICELEFMNMYVDGYWEALGYHERGNVYAEERFKRSRLETQS